MLGPQSSNFTTRCVLFTAMMLFTVWTSGCLRNVMLHVHGQALADQKKVHVSVERIVLYNVEMM